MSGAIFILDDLVFRNKSLVFIWICGCLPLLIPLIKAKHEQANKWLSFS